MDRLAEALVDVWETLELPLGAKPLGCGISSTDLRFEIRAPGPLRRPLLAFAFGASALRWPLAGRGGVIAPVVRCRGITSVRHRRHPGKSILENLCRLARCKPLFFAADRLA
ncbi:MAG: hypothetical protein MZV49_14655 [Rhodopseudomonas palustris]|nr:hypothetical protein [Rhodopseudomonas palustris]